MIRRRLLPLLAIAVGLAACDREPAPLLDLSSGRPSVVLIGLDTFRADHLGCYGNADVETPRLDEFARSAILFEDCASTSTWTLPSFASLFTGLLPQRHGAIGGRHTELDPSVVTLAEILGAQGYRTAGLVAVDYLTGHFGLDRGFERHRAYVGGRVSGRNETYAIPAFRAIGRLAAAPSFLFLHYFDAHAPYTAPEPFHRKYYEGDPTVVPQDPARRIEVIHGPTNRAAGDPSRLYQWLEGVRDLEYPVREYAAGVSYLDGRVGAALDTLEARGRFEDSIVIVVADHGEHLTEHDLYFTHRFPYRECLQVPLMIRLPGGQGGGTRVADPVSLVDLLPTLADLLQVPLETPVDGISLVGALRGEPLPDRVLFAEYGGREGNKVKAAWDREHRYLEFHLDSGVHRELYDRRRDPDERVDLAAGEPDRVARFQAALDREFGPERRLRVGGEKEGATLDPEVEERLRALGYIE